MICSSNVEAPHLQRILELFIDKQERKHNIPKLFLDKLVLFSPS